LTKDNANTINKIYIFRSILQATSLTALKLTEKDISTQ